MPKSLRAKWMRMTMMRRDALNGEPGITNVLLHKKMCLHQWLLTKRESLGVTASKISKEAKVCQLSKTLPCFMQLQAAASKSP